MAMTRLTLTVDEEVLRRAREHVQTHQTSISRLVNAFLRGLTEPDTAEYPPVIRRLMGILPETADESAYSRSLEEKYGML